jgi:hypothetical protein
MVEYKQLNTFGTVIQIKDIQGMGAAKPAAALPFKRFNFQWSEGVFVTLAVKAAVAVWSEGQDAQAVNAGYVHAEKGCFWG